MDTSQSKDNLNRGIHELNLGNIKKAILIFQDILKIEPKNVEALIKLGNIDGKLGRYKRAIENYDKVLRIEPTSKLALLNKGLAHHFLLDYDKAIWCFDKVLQTNSKNNVALYNKASSLIKKNQTEQGIKILQDIIKNDFSYKYKIKFDIDFTELHSDVKFQKLIS